MTINLAIAGKDIFAGVVSMLQQLLCFVPAADAHIASGNESIAIQSVRVSISEVSDSIGQYGFFRSGCHTEIGLVEIRVG